MHNISYTEAIREATIHVMDSLPETFVIGLGVSYANGADGTTKGLKERYPDRIFDTPVSEAALTGAAVGSAICGRRPIVHHGRVEFALFAIDQIITQAAKWNYMFGGGNPVSIVFRIAIGRQWGNGPQHTQALYGLFGGVPGLKVVIPSTPSQAKGLLVSAVRDNNPVVYLEPRWLYGTREDVDETCYETSLSQARVARLGKDVTVVTYGDGVVEAMRAASMLASVNIEVEVVDLVSLQPIDYSTIARSVTKTGRLVTLDTTHHCFSIGSQVISRMSQDHFGSLKAAPVTVACPDVPCPTSTALSELFYPTRNDLVKAIEKIVGRPGPQVSPMSFDDLHLSPKYDFTKGA